MEQNPSRWPTDSPSQTPWRSKTRRVVLCVIIVFAMWNMAKYLLYTGEDLDTPSGSIESYSEKLSSQDTPPPSTEDDRVTNDVKAKATDTEIEEHPSADALSNNSHDDGTIANNNDDHDTPPPTESITTPTVNEQEAADKEAPDNKADDKADDGTVATKNGDHDTLSPGDEKPADGTVASKGKDDDYDALSPGESTDTDKGAVNDGKAADETVANKGKDDDYDAPLPAAKEHGASNQEAEKQNHGGSTPEDQSASKNVDDGANDHDINDERANMELCGKLRCRILFVFHHAEQETRANIWFRVFVEVARQLDRVMVLPNVGGSRIFSCRPRPFDFYYDIDKLRKQYPDVTFIMQADFKEWTTKRAKPTTARLFKLSMGDQHQTYIQYNKISERRMRQQTCLDLPNLKFEQTNVYNTQITFANRYFASKETLTKTRELFFKELERTDPDVILLTHTNINTKLTNFREPPLAFSGRIKKEAMTLVNMLHPYVAIHWRMEQADPKNLPGCAIALVEFMRKFSRERKLQHIYLATDYPIVRGGRKGQSDTFYNINEYHHTAIRTLNESLTISTWNDLFTSSSVKIENMGSDSQGILDKLVCTHAEYFFRGPVSCRKPSSTWTSNVIKMRSELYKQHDHSGLKNIFQEWPQPNV